MRYEDRIHSQKIREQTGQDVRKNKKMNYKNSNIYRGLLGQKLMPLKIFKKI